MGKLCLRILSFFMGAGCLLFEGRRIKGDHASALCPPGSRKKKKRVATAHKGQEVLYVTVCWLGLGIPQRVAVARAVAIVELPQVCLAPQLRVPLALPRYFGTN
jgi:hypothetical protein